MKDRIDSGREKNDKIWEGAMTVSDYLLTPTCDERDNTNVLFLARHALDFSAERKSKYGYHVVYHEILLNVIRKLGFKVTPACDHQVLFGPLDFDFLYAIHSHAIFDGHELLAPAVAAYRGIPCLGSSATARAVSEDKVLAKQVAASLGLEVAEHRILSPGRTDLQGFNLSGSWIVKPRSGIASDAVTRVDDRSNWQSALEIVTDPRHGGRDFIAEEFVPGLNLTVPVVEGLPQLALAVIEERGRPGDNVLTNEGKRGLSRTYSSAPYDGPGSQEALEAATVMARAISPFDYARFDFRYDPEAPRLVFIEVNIACNMAPASAVYTAAALHSIPYAGLVQHVLTHSLRRQRQRKAALV